MDDEGSMRRQADADAAYEERQIAEAYAEGVAAERARWIAVVAAMHSAHDAYGSGFYMQDSWLAPYEKLRAMVDADRLTAN